MKSSPLVQRARLRADLPNEFPCMAKFWSARCNGGSTSPRSTSARRMSTIARIGSMPAGQRSTHAMHVVHCQTPSGRLIHAKTSSRALELGSSSERAAATSAAGPTNPVAATGHADKQSAHSMQSSRRTNGWSPSGRAPRGISLTRMSGRSAGKRA